MKKNEAGNPVPSDALFDFLAETGGDLFKAADGAWQYSVEAEGREGRSHFTYGRGATPQAAIMSHHLWKSNNDLRRGVSP